MNVYVPNFVDLSDPESPPASNLPVLVWFHGGAFWFGTGLSPLYDGRYLSKAIGAVIVTVNYRYSKFFVFHKFLKNNIKFVIIIIKHKLTSYHI